MRVNHSSNLEVTCNSCDFKSSSKRALREHLKAHDIFYDTKCDKCGYQCASRSALRNHMLQHNDSFVSCNYCDYKTKQRGNVIAHMKRKHPSTHFTRRKRGRRPRQLNKFEEENLDNACIKESHGNGVKFKARCKKTFKCTLCDSSFVREDSLKCHMKQHRDLSRASLSTAYAVLKLQQPIVNVNVQQDGNENLAEMVDTEAPFIPHGAKAKSQVQTQPDSTGSSLRTGHNQLDTGQTSSLGIKDILAAAGINNGSKDVSPSKNVYRFTDQAGSKNITSVTGGSTLVTAAAAAVTSEESLVTDLLPNFSNSSSLKNVSSLQSMQNISLPYIKLPDGQVLILSGQSQVSQTASLGETPETYLATKETVSGVSQDGDHESAYQVMLEPVQNVSFSQHVTIPASATQQGAIPIQIIVPSESQHSLPIVSQLLNSSINQNLAQKMSSQDSTTETPQNFVVHIPGNSGNLLKTSGPTVEGQSQSFVLQIPGPGPSYGINTDLQQHFASPGQGQLIQMGGDQSPGRQDVSA